MFLPIGKLFEKLVAFSFVPSQTEKSASVIVPRLLMIGSWSTLSATLTNISKVGQSVSGPIVRKKIKRDTGFRWQDMYDVGFYSLVTLG